MEYRKTADLQAENLILSKEKEIFLKDIRKIIKLFKCKDKNLNITEIKPDEFITRTSGYNCIQIDKKGEVFLLLSSGWKVNIKELKDTFLIKLLSPDDRVMELNFLSCCSIHNCILDTQRLVFLSLNHLSLFFVVFYFSGFRFIPVFSILLQKNSMRRFLCHEPLSIINEDFSDSDEKLLPLTGSPITLDIGKDLLLLMKSELKKLFLDRIASVRKHILQDMGTLVPPVKIKDNLGLKSREFVLNIKDIPVAAGEIYMNSFLAIGPLEQLKKLRGKIVLDPTYNMTGVWIKQEEREKAEKFGCMIFDPVSVIATLLTEVFRQKAHYFLGLQYTEELLKSVLKEQPVVYRELNKVISLLDFNKILKNLLSEGIPIRDLLSICETVIEYSGVTKDIFRLTEYVREALRDSICQLYTTFDGVIYVYLIEEELEKFLLSRLRKTDRENRIVLDEGKREEILKIIKLKYDLFQNIGMKAVLLCSAHLRPYLRKLIKDKFPSIVILSFNEIASGVKIKNLGSLSLGEKIDIRNLPELKFMKEFG